MISPAFIFFMLVAGLQLMFWASKALIMSFKKDLDQHIDLMARYKSLKGLK